MPTGAMTALSVSALPSRRKPCALPAERLRKAFVMKPEIMSIA
jgi:hypothetical protein